jgi:hypothetical protein
MRHQLDGWPGRVLLVAMVALTLAVGLCLFDDDEMNSDLCCGLAISSAAVFLATLGPVHLLSSGPRWAVYAVSLRRLDPPPRSPSFA